MTEQNQTVSDLLSTFEDDVICELGKEPDGESLNVHTTDEVVESLNPVVEELLIKAYQSGVEAEQKRIIDGLDKLQTHGLDVNIHLDEAIEVVKGLTNQGETK